MNVDPMLVVNRIPRLFHLLKAPGDPMNADLGVTTASAGGMASLARLGPPTVPELARGRPVSRQFIQSVVNDLAAAGLAETVANPLHKRSALVRLTERGRAAFAEVRARETAGLERAAPALAAADVAATQR